MVYKIAKHGKAQPFFPNGVLKFEFDVASVWMHVEGQLKMPKIMYSWRNKGTSRPFCQKGSPNAVIAAKQTDF